MLEDIVQYSTDAKTYSLHKERAKCPKQKYRLLILLAVSSTTFDKKAKKSRKAGKITIIRTNQDSFQKSGSSVAATPGVVNKKVFDFLLRGKGGKNRKYIFVANKTKTEEKKLLKSIFQSKKKE